MSAQTVRSDNIGVLEKEGVRLLNGVLAKGTISGTAAEGELVRVSSTGAGKLSVSRAGGSGVSGTLDVAARKVGTTALNGSCRLFEKVGTSAMREIYFDDLTCATVPSSKIAYAHKDSGGNIDVLVLDDVTGDLYTYGLVKNGEPQTGGSGELSYSNRTVYVENSQGNTKSIVSNMALPKDNLGGIVASANGERLAGSVSLTGEKNIRRSDFTTRDGKVYVTLSTQEMRVADNVQCYNKTTKTWFKSLEDCRAFSDNLTVYYDRPVKDGGKVRVVVAE